MQEIWKDIKGYEGLYQISNLGNVKSLPRKVNKRKCEEIIKVPTISNKGYYRISLCKNGKIKYYAIHRLVAEAFIPNYDNLPCVNHKDCNTKNNIVDNLEWITYKDNNNYKNHHLKTHIGYAISFLKNNYKDRIDLIQKLEDLREEINNL
jgi:hypothetical protein